MAVICHCYNSKICLLHKVIVKDELHTVVISYCKHVIVIVKAPIQSVITKYDNIVYINRDCYGLLDLCESEYAITPPRN